MAAGASRGAPDLAVLAMRLERILDPYRDRLETAAIYGIPTLRRRGAAAHQWFAFVRPASRHVAFHLLPVHTWPELGEGLSPALAARLTGRATFTFRAIDEALFAELEALVGRAFDRYLADTTIGEH